MTTRIRFLYTSSEDPNLLYKSCIEDKIKTTRNIKLFFSQDLPTLHLVPVNIQRWWT
jgi:hypothetical protein